MKKNNYLYGGVEAGGTKFICGLSSSPPDLSSEIHFGTTSPQESLEKVCEFFFPFVKDGRIRSIGVAAFGPVDTDIHSPTYGFITATPKPNWQNIDILGFLKRAQKGLLQRLSRYLIPELCHRPLPNHHQ